MDEEEREARFAEMIGESVAEVRKLLLENLLVLKLMTLSELDQFITSEPGAARGDHWVSAFASAKHEVAEAPAIPVVHFYGYKGGQARSTVLGLLAASLAEDGWKVLVVDSDLEAPSLDVIFATGNRDMDGSLVGLSRGATPRPERALTPSSQTGYVDLISCRPKSAEYDLDAAAFALRAAMDPSVIQGLASKIISLAKSQAYDVLLVDHRAGLSASTLPWMRTLPGPTVICVRLDEQWRIATNAIQAILNNNPTKPGLFISLKPDSEIPESFKKRNAAQIGDLLGLLAISIRLAATSDEGDMVTGEELTDHWIMWPYDESFRQARLPQGASLSHGLQQALFDVRSILGIKSEKEPPERPLTPSGSTDAGDLIQTDALRQLTAPNNSISYVFGRKGTGKTRLMNELARAGHGEPLIVQPDDRSAFGLPSSGAEVSSAIKQFEQSPDDFWWALLATALRTGTTARSGLETALHRELEQSNRRDFRVIVIAAAESSPRKRTFLIDGLETAFPSRLTFPFLESLFRFLQVAESDPRIARAVEIKLFLRQDLAQRGYQNIEQQLSGRTIHLSWDTQKIFNFALSRMSQNAWFKRTFPALVNRIRQHYSKVLDGNLDVETCEDMFLMAFPERLPRNNIATRTFLRTYFSDSAGDKDTYYPRVFDKFFNIIGDPGTIGDSRYRKPPELENGRIAQGIIYFAHDQATKEHLAQLRQELIYLIPLSEDRGENDESVGRLLSAFSGLPTPFQVDVCVASLAQRTSFAESDIRAAIDRMKSVGMFEDRPGYSNEWRVGRLFKSALGMKYVRG